MNEPKVRISFWGTPPISATFLEKLIHDNRFEISFVVTQQDKPRSHRGRKIEASPVKQIADANNIPVFTPASLRFSEKNRERAQKLLEEMQKFSVDFHVVLAYGKIIPEDFYSYPSLAAVNFHASLLPFLRGAAPIEFSLINGFKETGWTLQKITDELDAGDVFAQTKVTVDYPDTRSTLYTKLTDDLLQHGADILYDYGRNALTPHPQNENEASHCSKITTEMGLLDFSLPAELLRNRARALEGKPGVFAFFRGKKVKLFLDTSAPMEKTNLSPGELEINDSILRIAAGDLHSLAFSSLQFEGKKAMAARDFSNGYSPKAGEKMEMS